MVCRHPYRSRFRISEESRLETDLESNARNHQKIVKPQFFEYLRMRRGRQESVTAAGKWLVAQNVARQGLLTVEETQDDSASSGRWGGQLSQSVLATEIMPCLRLLKKTGAREWQDEKDNKQSEV